MESDSFTNDPSAVKPSTVKPSTVALWLLLVALTASNVLLLRQNLKLRAALAPSKPETLHAGDRAAPFVADGLRGERIDVSYGGVGPKRVLLFFTPTCPFCRQQFAYWREMLARSDRTRFEVIGVVNEKEDKAKLEDYLRQFGCGGDSPTPLRVALVPEAVRRDYKLSATPITLVVSNDGVVEKAWEGRWGVKELGEAGELLGVSFSVAAK